MSPKFTNFLFWLSSACAVINFWIVIVFATMGLPVIYYVVMMGICGVAAVLQGRHLEALSSNLSGRRPPDAAKSPTTD